MPTQPDSLDLYRLSVQHPLAEVAFLDRAWSHYHGEDAAPALLLREDFAGTCSVAAAWCASDPERQAMAIEIDAPTAQWATDQHADQDDLHILADDVMAVDEPATDITIALNFSVLIYHDEVSLLAYLRHAKQCLTPGGLLILDLLGAGVPGNRGENEPRTESQHITPDALEVPPFTYHWEQRHYDADTKRIDCRIHFELEDGSRIDNAFRYDWRLWTVSEVLALMQEAGFTTAEAWGSANANQTEFHPLSAAPPDGDWVVYVVGVC